MENLSSGLDINNIRTLAFALQERCHFHTIEYRRREDLWRKRQLDIMQLACFDINGQIEDLNTRLRLAMRIPAQLTTSNQGLIDGAMALVRNATGETRGEND